MKLYFPESGRNLVGEKIRRLRIARGLSQKDLAAKMQTNGYEISDLTVLRIEKGKRLVTDFELMAFCEVFKISPNELLEYQDPGP